MSVAAAAAATAMETKTTPRQQQQQQRPLKSALKGSSKEHKPAPSREEFAANSTGAVPGLRRRDRLVDYRTAGGTSSRQPAHRRVLYRGTAKQYDIKLRNLVVKCQLNVKIPLGVLAEIGGWYKSNTFTSMVKRYDKPYLTVDVFSTGLLVATGAKQLNQVELGVTLACHEISKILGTRVTFSKLKQENMVASAGTGVNFNQRLFVSDFPEPVTRFTPETFSAVSYFPKFPEEKPVAIIFATGKIVFTGASSWKELKSLSTCVDWKKYEMGKEYRKLDVDPILIRAQTVQATKQAAAATVTAATATTSSPLSSAAGAAAATGKAQLPRQRFTDTAVYSLSAAASISTAAIDSSAENTLAAPAGSIWMDSHVTDDAEVLFSLAH